ncbi:MAG: nucleotidyltransferase domain-containing protein [Candidatus Nanohalobium sp.]
MSESKHRKAFEDFADRAQEELGNSLQKLVLYGSVARGDETRRSDVDVFAVVEDGDDLDILRDLAFDVGVMEHGVSISVQGRVTDEFEGFSETSYLRNVERDGVEYA